MIPVKLTLQGLYSYQTSQTIDFTRLMQASVFGIFGTVGSGKSSVLEAITFALYGKTDRLNLSGDNRNYNMMNLKSNELFIEFTFRANHDNSLYMVIVKGRRNSRQFEDVKALERSAYLQDKNGWTPVPLETLEAAIGLNYDNFKRTIIIPQGKFQEFLQLSDKDRTQMMKELFNLEKFELFHKVTYLEVANERDKQSCTLLLQQLGDITTTRISDLAKTLESLKIEIEKQSALLEATGKTLAEQRQLKDLMDNLARQELLLSQMKEQEQQVRIVEESLRKLEYCIFHFKGLLENAASTTQKITSLENSLKQDHLRKDLLTQEAEVLQQTYQVISKEYENKELLKKQAEELEKLKRLNNLDEELKKLNQRIINGDHALSEITIKADQCKKQLETLAQSLKEVKSQLPDLNLLSKIKEWHTVNILLQEAYLKLQEELENAHKEMENLRLSQNTLCTGKWLLDSDIPLTLDDAGKQVEKYKQSIRSCIVALDKEAAHLQLQQKLEAYSEALEEGKPCPLCGSTEHPMIAGFSNITEPLQQNRTQQGVYEKELVLLEEHQKKIGNLSTSINIHLTHLEKIESRKQDHLLKIEIHRSSFIWDTYQEVSTVNKAFMEAEKLNLQITQQEKEMEGITQKLGESIIQKEQFTEAIKKINNQVIALNSEKETLSSQIHLYDALDFKEMSVDAMNNKIEVLLKRHTTIEKEYNDFQEKIKKNHSDSAIISGRLEANLHALAQEKDLLLEHEKKIQLRLSQSEYKTVSEIEVILASNRNVDQDKKMVTEFRQKIDYVQKQKTTLTEAIGDRIFDALNFQELLDQQARLNSNISLKHQEYGSAENEFKKLQFNFVKRQELEKKLGTLDARAEDIKTLKQLFKASGFVNYISSVYLQELCAVANERFSRLTRQKLSLEVTDDNNFEVRDFLNGGKVRSVKTLSGGQTFQAALSLALALADNIQKITASGQNFFFLDEGFGSLDKESLGIVFDTLKSLRKENRIIGVISHVEDMQQEIDNHLLIVNDEKMGSIVVQH